MLIIVAITVLHYSVLPLVGAELIKYVAVWLFDEGAGDVVKDVSGNGHDGKFAGKPKWVKAEFGGGLEFPGNDGGYIVVESTKKLELETLSIEAWVKVEEGTGKWQGIVCKQQAGCNNRNYGIWVHVDQHVLHSEIGANGACGFSMDATTDITDNKWHHLAFTYDGKMGRAYVDGELEIEAPNGATFQSADPITIGVPNLNNANGLKGVIDEIRISNVARKPKRKFRSDGMSISRILSVAGWQTSQHGGDTSSVRHRAFQNRGRLRFDDD